MYSIKKRLKCFRVRNNNEREVFRVIVLVEKEVKVRVIELLKLVWLERCVDCKHARHERVARTHLTRTPVPHVYPYKRLVNLVAESYQLIYSWT